MEFEKRKWASASGRGFPKVLEKMLVSQNIKRDRKALNPLNQETLVSHLPYY
jgi:hypothetical protein